MLVKSRLVMLPHGGDSTDMTDTDTDTGCHKNGVAYPALNLRLAIPQQLLWKKTSESALDKKPVSTQSNPASCEDFKLPDADVRLSPVKSQRPSILSKSPLSSEHRPRSSLNPRQVKHKPRNQRVLTRTPYQTMNWIWTSAQIWHAWFQPIWLLKV